MSLKFIPPSSDWKPEGGVLVDLPRAEVGGHDEHRVAEGHRVAEIVGELPFLQNLQEDVEHIRVRLLDLVQKDHAERPQPSDLLREEPAFLIAHVSRGSPDKPGHVVLLHEVRHVDANKRIGSSNRNSATSFCDQSFPRLLVRGTRRSPGACARRKALCATFGWRRR